RVLLESVMPARGTLAKSTSRAQRSGGFSHWRHGKESAYGRAGHARGEEISSKGNFSRRGGVIPLGAGPAPERALCVPTSVSGTRFVRPELFSGPRPCRNSPLITHHSPSEARCGPEIPTPSGPPHSTRAPMFEVGNQGNAGQRGQPEGKQTVSKNDHDGGGLRHSQERVESHHRGLDHPDAAEDHSQLAEQLRDSVTGQQHGRVDRIACRQKEKAQGRHVKTSAENCAHSRAAPSALDQRVPSFEQVADGGFDLGF